MQMFTIAPLNRISSGNTAVRPKTIEFAWICYFSIIKSALLFVFLKFDFRFKNICICKNEFINFMYDMKWCLFGISSPNANQNIHFQNSKLLICPLWIHCIRFYFANPFVRENPFFVQCFKSNLISKQQMWNCFYAN